MKSVLIVGGAGNLGRALVKTFRQSWKIANIDLKKNEDAHLNYLLDYNHRLPIGIEEIYKTLEDFAPKFDAILCVSGFFGVASVSKLEVFEHYDQMKRSKLVPFFLGGHLATKYLDPHGLLMFTGSGLALHKSSPEAIAFNATSNAIHSFIRSASQDDSFPSTSTIFGLCPEGLNTPQVRELVPEANHKAWPTPENLAHQIYSWAQGEYRPKRGSFVYVKAGEGGRLIIETKKPLFIGHL